MDLSFGRDLAAGTFRGTPTGAPFAPGGIAGRLQGIDYPRLIAILSSSQAASRTARTAARLRGGVAGARADGIVAMLDPACDWIAAGHALGGSFHPALARRRQSMKVIFTLEG